MTLVFHPLAERELIAATRFYETRASGLGADFIREVERALVQVVANPRAGQLLARGAIRRRLLRRFPFAVVYEFASDNITVLAMMHLRRRPGYWRRRLRVGSFARR